MNTNLDLSGDDLSSTMGIETLLAHDLVLEALPASSKGPAEQQVHHIGGEGGGARYLVVDQGASRRHSSKVSKIWQDGMELRALDSANLDKYWLCNHCLPTRKSMFPAPKPPKTTGLERSDLIIWLDLMPISDNNTRWNSVFNRSPELFSFRRRLVSFPRPIGKK
jgi:hypothetical protein